MIAFAPLSRLRQLYRLDLSRTAVSDLGPLLRHDSLGTLGLVGLKVLPAQLRALRARNTDLRLLLTQASLDRENTSP